MADAHDVMGRGHYILLHVVAGADNFSVYNLHQSITTGKVEKTVRKNKEQCEKIRKYANFRIRKFE